MSDLALNFDGVEEAINNLKPQAKQGIGIYTIEKLEFKSNKNGNPFVWVSFGNGTEELRHQFYLTAASITRLQTLAKAATGNLLTGQLTPENLEAIFIGKKVRLKVDSVTRSTATGQRTFPDLAFAGFAESPSVETKWKDSDAVNKIEAPKAPVASAPETTFVLPGESAPTAPDSSGLPF